MIPAIIPVQETIQYEIIINHINISDCEDVSDPETCLLTIPAIADLILSNCSFIDKSALLQISSETIPRSSIDMPKNIRLTDSDFHVLRPVDLLIGARATLSLFSIGQILLLFFKLIFLLLFKIVLFLRYLNGVKLQLLFM
jgi:hypothetical protein